MADPASVRRATRRSLAGVVLWTAHAAASALSPLPPTPPPLPGAELLRAGRCAEFAAVASALDPTEPRASFAEGWVLEIMRGVERSKQPACLAMLPERIRNAIYLAAARLPDHTLLQDYVARGGQLAAIRNDTDNLATTAARAGDLALLQWLRSAGLRPLLAGDRANELAAAAWLLVSDGWRSSGRGAAIVDWLLQNGYQLPADGVQGQQLLAALLRANDLPRLRAIAQGLRREGKLAATLQADGQNGAEPLVFFVESTEGVAILDELGANLHASSRLHGPSALFRIGLPADTQRSLLARKVSVAGTGPLGASPLRNALSTLDPELVDQVLAAGATLQTRNNRADDIVHELAGIAQERVPPDLLRRLVRVLVKHGADPRSPHAPYPGPYPLYEGDLPVHTALLARNLQLVPVWLQEAGLGADVRHPKSGLSLMGFALQHPTYFRATPLPDVLKALAAAGAPPNPAGESLLVLAVRSDRAPSEELLETLLSLGADVNAVHAPTGTTALAQLLRQPPYRVNDCLYPASGPCVDEPPSQRQALVRWFIAHGAKES